MKQVLVFDQLTLEAHVRKNNGSPLTGKRESILKLHTFILHEVGDDATGTAGYTRVAVDKDTAPINTLPDEGDRCREVTQETAL